ncbi:hypothetical protein CIPAW_15G118500 [Carya illinoinensis]|uniref:Uncharacterized protein n=1 Tax=Carya illinoinensis TaxID=32201 RepID=A0A8T1NEB0_CARIL|nr:hypothetical protein CIPAW_15G118500 [Carya illinoinensis]KAG6675496.1 hypothetical protein I3842_15G105700 [Carya illinoinensis]
MYVPSGKLSLFTDLLCDPVFRVRTRLMLPSCWWFRWANRKR